VLAREPAADVGGHYALAHEGQGLAGGVPTEEHVPPDRAAEEPGDGGVPHLDLEHLVHIEVPGHDGVARYPFLQEGAAGGVGPH